MKLGNEHQQRSAKKRLKAASFLCTATFVLTASITMPQQSCAVEIKLLGSGTFKPPKAEQLASLPDDLSFSPSDLASGKWSFSVIYDDNAPDSEPNAYVGRYVTGIRSFRLVIGGASMNFPVDQAAIVVSDGGGSFPNRESIRVEVKALMPSGLLRLSWVQVNHQPTGNDLRGPGGRLANDAMAPYSTVAYLATANPFDRFLELRIDRSSIDLRPLFYLSSSELSVTAGPATAP